MLCSHSKNCQTNHFDAKVLALRICKTVEGDVTLSMYKSAMLAALRSMLPRTFFQTQKMGQNQHANYTILLMEKNLYHVKTTPANNGINYQPLSGDRRISEPPTRITTILSFHENTFLTWNPKVFGDRTWDPNHETAWNWLWDVIDKHLFHAHFLVLGFCVGQVAK